MSSAVVSSSHHPTTLLFHSSEIAAAVGKHKYKKKYEAFQGIFERINHGSNFRKATERLAKLGVKFVNKDERIQKVVTDCKMEEDVQQFLTQPVQTSEELKQRIESFEDQCGSQENVFKEQKNQLKDELAQQTQQHTQATENLNQLKQIQEKLQQDLIAWGESDDEVQAVQKRQELVQLQTELQTQQGQTEQWQTAVFTQIDKLSRHEQQWSNFKTTKKDLIGLKQTSFGKQKEESLIASQVLGLVSDNNTHFYQKLLGTKPFTWGVCGRIDGFRDGELIEIKNRKSHIYNPLPQYDIIQLQCYMQLLDVPQATLIQSLATENNTYQTHETVVLRDDAYWNNFLRPELTLVAYAMSKFLNDTLLQDKFLQTPDNKKSYVLTSLLHQVRKELDPSSSPKRKKASTDAKETPAKKQKQTSSVPASTSVVTMDDFMDGLMAGTSPSVPSPPPPQEKDTATPQEKDTATPQEKDTAPPQTDTAPPQEKDTAPPQKDTAPPQKDTATPQKDTATPQKDTATPPPPMRVCFFDTLGDPPAPVADCSIPLVQYLPSDWALQVGDQLQKPYFQKLETFINQDYKTFIVYPPRDQIFTAFHKCPWEKVRVVILAQDPYINPGEAMGMAFSVPKGTKFPKSLKNIFEELQSDVKISPPLTGDLTPWANQGVLLINTVMTVRAGKSDSHTGQGWEPFTDFVIRQLSTEKPHLVFLLWGAKAQSKRGLIDAKKHTLLETSHPSPLSYSRGFKGCRHFTKTNEALGLHGSDKISSGSDKISSVAFLRSMPIVWDLNNVDK